MPLHWHLLVVVLGLFGVLLLVVVSPGAESERLRLEQLLERTAAVLEAGGVTYWVSDGTLLGAVRDARVVLGDYDADLNIPVESVDAMRRVDWRRAGLVCYEGFGGFRVKASSLDTLRVDIFVRRDDGHGVLLYGWPALDTAYETAVVPSGLIYPLRRYAMSTFAVYGPREAALLLRQQYGNYEVRPPTTWTSAAWICFEKHVWARGISVASFFSPAMPY